MSPKGIHNLFHVRRREARCWVSLPPIRCFLFVELSKQEFEFPLLLECFPPASRSRVSEIRGARDPTVGIPEPPLKVLGCGLYVCRDGCGVFWYKYCPGRALHSDPLAKKPELSAKRQNETTMSKPRLPPELLDHTVNLLQDTEPALRNCCLVSKSWIPRTRKYLFADITLRVEGELESWKEIFPDPSTSPSCYTKSLYVDCARAITAADAAAGGWITGFSRVVHLEVGDLGSTSRGSAISLVPFHGFSPIIKSLRIAFTALSSSQMFALMLSFPLLEDLTAITYYKTEDNTLDELSNAVQPPNPPTFTGSLGLSLRGMEPIVHRLLSLPGGIHFRKLDLMWSHEEDTSSVVALVEKCSHTLESLDITRDLFGTSTQFPRPHW